MDVPTRSLLKVGGDEHRKALQTLPLRKMEVAKRSEVLRAMAQPPEDQNAKMMRMLFVVALGILAIVFITVIFVYKIATKPSPVTPELVKSGAALLWLAVPWRRGS